MDTRVDKNSNIEVPIFEPKLSTYTDFRKYLKDFYRYKKKTESNSIRGYSYSHFSAAADIKSPNYLKLIIEGKRNLSEEMIKKFSKALRLSRGDFEEFRVLVKYGQATDPMSKNQYLKELSEMRAKKSLQNGDIDEKTWNTVPNWISWVIYAMLDQDRVEFDPLALQKIFRSHVTPEQVKSSIDRLVESQQVEIHEEGDLRKSRAMVDGQNSIPVELVRKLQAELIYLGLESLYRDSPKEREFGAFTLALTQKEFEDIRFELRKVRKKIQKDIMMNREQTKGERVYQLNIQLFPITNSATREL